MNSERVLAAIITILSVIFFIYCQKNKYFEASHTEETDVPLVENPTASMINDILTLKEELRIKESDSLNNYLLVKPISIKLDEAENIYILDLSDANIKVFDKLGRLLRVIGRKGAGPGELNSPSSMDIFKKTELVVLDSGNRRVSFYSLDGKYKRGIPTSGISLSGLKTDSQGNIFARVDRFSNNQRKYEIQKFDSNMNFLTTIASVKAPVEASAYLFFPSQSYFITKDDLIIYGYPESQYEIKIFTNQGRLLKRIRKDYSPIRIYAEDLEWIKSRTPPDVSYTIAEHYPPYIHIEGDDERRIIVLAHLKQIDPNQKSLRYRESEYDFFDSEGNYLTSIRLAHCSGSLWKNGRLYTIEEDAFGLPLIKIYRVSWKEIARTG